MHMVLIEKEILDIIKYRILLGHWVVDDEIAFGPAYESAAVDLIKVLDYLRAHRSPIGKSIA